MESINLVNKGKYAYIYFKSNLQNIIDNHYTDLSGFSNMHIAREEIFSGTYAWAFPKVSAQDIRTIRTKVRTSKD